MTEQKKKRQRIYDLQNAKTKPSFLCLPYTSQKTNLQKKEFFLRKGEVEDWTKNEKEAF